MLNAGRKVQNFIGIFFIDHFEWEISDRSLKPDQFFVLNGFGACSVFGQMYRLKLINRQIWESLLLGTATGNWF